MLQALDEPKAAPAAFHLPWQGVVRRVAGLHSEPQRWCRASVNTHASTVTCPAKVGLPDTSSTDATIVEISRSGFVARTPWPLRVGMLCDVQANWAPARGPGWWLRSSVP